MIPSRYAAGKLLKLIELIKPDGRTVAQWLGSVRRVSQEESLPRWSAHSWGVRGAQENVNCPAILDS